MSYVITERCLGERYAQCVDVCPADCIYPGAYQNQVFMVIDPDLCINCHACLDVCPVNAIVATEEENPTFARINAECSPQYKNNPPVSLRDPNDTPRHRH